MRLLRPLLGWRRAELQQVCTDAGLTPALDPSNADERFERVRIRNAIGEANWLDVAAVARSAAHLADADAALDWAVRIEWDRNVRERGGEIRYRPGDAPQEIVRRIVSKALRKLATEGEAELRGSELDRLLACLGAGDVSTLRGVRCSGGKEWRFSPATARRA